MFLIPCKPQTHKFHYILFRQRGSSPKGQMSVYSALSRWRPSVFVCRVFACLVLAVGMKPVLARLWSLAFPCTASACGVACLLPVCVRGSLAWFIGPWHTALWTPPLLLEWLFHVSVVHPPGWFSTDGGQMWSCSGALGNMPCRQCGEKLLSENMARSQFLLRPAVVWYVCNQDTNQRTRLRLVWKL